MAKVILCEWENEPDSYDFESHGFKCSMRRNEMGAWCGYVGVPKNHPWYGKDYSDVEVEIHGGLTYSDKNIFEGKNRGLWWFGFDCSHCFDLAPELYKRFPNLAESRDVVYRNKAYVIRECESLANQLGLVEI